MTTRDEVLSLLATPHTRRELREALRCGESTANDHIARLLRCGAIMFCGNRETSRGHVAMFRAIPGAKLKPSNLAAAKACAEAVTDRRRSILYALMRSPLTHEDIAAGEGIIRRDVARIMDRMVTIGYVEFAGFAPRVASKGPQPWLWKITAKGREALK